MFHTYGLTPGWPVLCMIGLSRIYSASCCPWFEIEHCFYYSFSSSSCCFPNTQTLLGLQGPHGWFVVHLSNCYMYFNTHYLCVVEMFHYNDQNSTELALKEPPNQLDYHYPTRLRLAVFIPRLRTRFKVSMLTISPSPRLTTHREIRKKCKIKQFDVM